MSETKCDCGDEYCPYCGIGDNAVRDVEIEQLENALEDARKTLSIAWAALRRTGWEEGPTANEADEAVHNYCQRAGMDEDDEPLMSMWKD